MHRSIVDWTENEEQRARREGKRVTRQLGPTVEAASGGDWVTLDVYTGGFEYYTEY